MPKLPTSQFSFPLTDDDLKEISKDLSHPLPNKDTISASDIASLTVSDMKSMLKYINDHKLEPMMKLRSSGKKQELKSRLEKYLWPDKRQGVILASRDDRLGSLTKRPSSLLCKRVVSYAEKMSKQKIEADLTLNGRQDPYAVIDTLLDLAEVKQQTGKVELDISLTPEQMEKLGTLQYDIHLYWLTASLNPHNWQDATVSWNDFKLTLPRANRKLKKKLKKKVLITSTPIVVPRNLVRQQNLCTVLHPHWIPVDGNFVVALVRNFTTKDLVSKVKHRTEQWAKEEEEKKVAEMGGRFAAPTDPDELIMYDDEVITLNDALTLERIEEPGRGKSCLHKTCFDLESYLEYSHSSCVWNCPVCDTPLRYEDLIIDYNIKRIISEVDPEVDKVRLHGDGSYTLIIPQGPTVIGEGGGAGGSVGGGAGSGVPNGVPGQAPGGGASNTTSSTAPPHNVPTNTPSSSAQQSISEKDDETILSLSTSLTTPAPRTETEQEVLDRLFEEIPDDSDDQMDIFEDDAPRHTSKTTVSLRDRVSTNQQAGGSTTQSAAVQSAPARALGTSELPIEID